MAQELVKLDRLLPAEPIANLADLKATWAKLQDHCNLVTPVAQVDSILPMHRVSLRAVVVNPFVNAKGLGPEVYKAEFCEKDERALGKVGIEKIMAAAGAQTIGKLRLDDRSEAYYVELEYTLALRDFDGHMRQVTKSKAIDLRDGSALASKFSNSPAMLRHQREHILSLAESKAALRCARTLLILKQKYTLDELARPFVIPKLVVSLDPADPDQKAALIEMAVHGDRLLYGMYPAPGAAMRLLRDVTPPPAALPAPTGPGSQPPPLTPVDTDPDEPEDEDESFEVLEGAEEEIIHQCGCPCSCLAELSETTAASTMELLGTKRCRECFPGKGFNLKKHEGIRDLAYPKRPKVTVESLAEALKK